MSRRSLRAAGALAVALAAAPIPARAQAFTPPDGVGAVTLAWQYVDNTGHRLTDGTFRASGQSVTTSGLLEVEYGVTDRLAATLGIPYVFAKYTGKEPPLSGQPVDFCRCWQSGFADFSASVRYRFGDDAWAVTPVVRLGQPSHAYPYKGEAVVGKQLTEAQVGVAAGLRLLSRINLQGSYTYAFVEKALDEISVNRSNVVAGVGYGVNRRLHVHAAWLWQHTHGGLRLGSPTGDPFFPPGEINTPERRAAADQIRMVRWMQVAGGLSFDAGPVDLFASYTKYVWGRDAHNGQVFGAGVTWYFGLPE
ncbi:MAG TPA: hypothetical protein VFM88_07045 [Vicinamibacteria bacterium]|nr:hypothetical protein [Vicinamibacteria bacterium]